jgi:hypothetical protein
VLARLAPVTWLAEPRVQRIAGATVLVVLLAAWAAAFSLGR